MAEKKTPKKSTAEPKRQRSRLPQGIIIALIGLAGAIIVALISVLLPPFVSLSQPPTAIYITPTPIPISIIDSRGIIMRLIPDGVFIMGSDNGSSNSKPSHKVYLESYYIDEHEVTNKQYRDCFRAGVCKEPFDKTSPSRNNYFYDTQYDDYPVVWVNWEMAKKYCSVWREAELPTEARWEKAARSPDSRSFPWGEEISCRNANYAGCVGDTLVVGLFEDGKSVYGVYDMVGNVSEWVLDWYSDSYYVADKQYDPPGPLSGHFRVVRGGSWYVKFNGIRLFERTAHLPTFVDKDLGFRCVRDYEP